MALKIVSVLSVGLLATLALSGCTGSIFVTPLTCDYYPFTVSVEPGEDWQDANREVRRAVRDKHSVEDEGEDIEWQRIFVKNWRTSDVDEFRETAESTGREVNGSYIDWESYHHGIRPGVIDDLLCWSEWRVENISTLTPLPIDTEVVIPKAQAIVMMDELHAEHERQNREKIDGEVIIRWEGGFYSADFKRETTVGLKPDQ